jgi:hypothetical protein
MEVYVSINGVLRNFLQKFTHHYQDYYFESDVIETKSIDPVISEEIEEGISELVVGNSEFVYTVKEPIYDGTILDHFTFQSEDEFKYFTYVEFPLEIFGHAGLSNPTSISDLNQLISENPDVNFTLVGIDEFAKAKPSTLFFLSKNACLSNNIRFIRSEDIENEWNKCDVWITSSPDVTKLCPTGKKVIKFNTEYNTYFTINLEINKLTEIDPLWLKYTENIIT